MKVLQKESFLSVFHRRKRSKIDLVTRRQEESRGISILRLRQLGLSKFHHLEYCFLDATVIVAGD